MSQKNRKVKTVSEKIAETFLPDELADPENDSESLVKIAEFTQEDDFGSLALSAKTSEIRKRNTKLLSDFSDKYKGKVSSRRELEAEDDDNDATEESEDAEIDDSETDGFDSELEDYKTQLKEGRKITTKDTSKFHTSNVETEEDGSDVDGRQVSDEDMDQTHISGQESADSDSGNDQSQDEEEEDSDENDPDYASSAAEDSTHDDDTQNQIISESNQNTEIQKGLAVQNQLKIWEKLLEVRIHSQKMVTKANSLPPPDTFNQFCDGNENYKNLVKDSVKNLEQLLENMLEMQSLLASQYSELKGIIKTGTKRPSTGGKSNAEPAVKRFATSLTCNFESLTPYRNAVLQKWDDRTKILTPGAGGKKGGNHSASDNYDVVRKIEAVLLNRNDLVAKSRIVKGNYRPFGVHEINDQEEKFSSPEIYDDTDFYHQQLRELIEYKSNTSSNPTELNKQFAELQKLRQKMKKKVDTRASKGRKIRYVVHNKLVNFMAPNSNSDWSEESKTELYRSLFAT